MKELLERQYADGEIQALLAEAKYHLGRVLFEAELDFDRAVSELEDTVGLDPDNVRAYYYLGQAIRAQIERETLRRAQSVLRTYLARGAPLGHEEDVREFLGARRPLARALGMQRESGARSTGGTA